MEAPASLKVHMAAGPMGQVDGEGVYSTVSMPEEDFVFYLGESVDEFSQYVMYEGEIYLCSRFLIQFLDGLSWEATLDPLPAAVDIDLLESLTVEKDGHKTVYRLSREPRVMENNDLETDSSGNVVYDTLVAENGESMAFSAFEARYEQFSAVRMSGRLNENYDPPSEPSAKYTLVTTGGAKRELTLYAYDAFHDAVGVDGVFLCYLIKGGLSF